MRKMARLIGVAVILATLAMSQSMLMAAPYVGATKASANSGLMDRLIDILSAVWGGGGNSGSHSAVWGGGGNSGSHSAVWGGGNNSGSHSAVWGGGANNGSDSAVWGSGTGSH